jgi:predicted ATPase
MKFKTILIENYKGIETVEIDFTHNRIITLVGLNESGKTTILQAIDFFKNISTGIEKEPSEFNLIRPKGIKFSENIVLKATFDFEQEDKDRLTKFLKKSNKTSKLNYPNIFSLTYSFKYDKNAYTGMEKSTEFACRTNKTKDPLKKSNPDLYDLIVQELIDNYIPEVLLYEDFIFEIPDKIIFDKGVEDQYGDQQSQWKDVLDDIIYAVDEDFDSFNDFVVELWQTDNDTARQRISAMEKKLDRVITKAWKVLFNEEKTSQSSRLNFKEIKIIPNPEPNNVLSFSFKVKTEGGKEFSINERSKGCKWFFSFIIFTEFRKKRTDNILFLLDEPASNLHSSAQLKILDAIDSLKDESIIIYSTHSHHLINPKWLNGAYIVINEGISEDVLEGSLSDTDSKITVGKYFKYVSDKKQTFQTLYFQPILDRLDYKPSFLEPIPFITICEGKFDWFTFKFINETILRNKFQINFYPGKGKDNNLDIIRLYLSWGSKFILILDGDEGGEESKKGTYLKEFGKILEDKVFTLNDILGKAVETEDLFSVSDKQNLCNTAFGDGQFESVNHDFDKLKSKINFAIQQLYVNGIEITLETKTTNSFNLLFEFLVKKQNE